MKNLFLICLSILFLFACSKKAITTTSKPKAQNHSASAVNDSLYKDAIIIKQTNETKGIKAEYDWLDRNYKGYKLKQQSLSFFNHKPYDILTITTAKGEEKDIYFDISAFFGKY